MLTKSGPQILEFNARFGDPETQPLLVRMASDIIPIFEACIDGTLDQCNLEWKKSIIFGSSLWAVLYLGCDCKNSL